MLTAASPIPFIRGMKRCQSQTTLQASPFSPNLIPLKSCKFNAEKWLKPALLSLITKHPYTPPKIKEIAENVFVGNLVNNTSTAPGMNSAIRIPPGCLHALKILLGNFCATHPPKCIGSNSGRGASPQSTVEHYKESKAHHWSSHQPEPIVAASPETFGLGTDWPWIWCSFCSSQTFSLGSGSTIKALCLMTTNQLLIKLFRSRYCHSTYCWRKTDKSSQLHFPQVLSSHRKSL